MFVVEITTGFNDDFPIRRRLLILLVWWVLISLKATSLHGNEEQYQRAFQATTALKQILSSRANSQQVTIPKIAPEPTIARVAAITPPGIQSPSQLDTIVDINQKQQQQQPVDLDVNSLETLNFNNNNNNNNQEDQITYLDYSSMNDEILRKKTANIVYFNANFNHCRHCFKFFNTWKELAHDIRWWRQVIRLHAINCSDEDNIETCRRAGVTQFPQVKYYWVMSSSLDQDGQRLRILGKSVHAMRHLIMDKVLDSFLEHKKLLAQRQKSASSPLSNPLVALMPILSQLMAPAGGGGGGGSAASMFGLLTGKGGGGGGGDGGMPSFGGLLNQMGGFQGVSQLINALTSAASIRKSLSIQVLPKGWPELDQIVVMDTQRLLDLLPLDSSRGKGALLVMETQEFLYTGLEVMLDLNPYANSTHIVRVRDEQSQLCKNLTSRDDIRAPALIYITGNREPKLIMTAPKFTNDEDLRRVFVRAFERKQIKYPVKRVWSAKNQAGSSASSASSSSSSDTEMSQENEEILQRLNDVHMSDLTNALRASLMEQVFRHTDLSDDQYNALVRYVYAVINYFPFNDDESLKFVKRLHTWLQNQVSPIDISEYKKQFHDADEALGKREWVACKSLSNNKAIPNNGRKSVMLFENPAQFGKIVSNITRLFRANQQKAGQLKNLLSVFTGSSTPVMLSNQNSQTTNQTRQQMQLNNKIGLTTINSAAMPTTSAPTSKPISTTTPSPSPSSSSSSSGDNREESPIERIIKSLTSGSLGSDSSILKLISTALTGGGSDDNQMSAAGSKSKFAREYPCGIWKLAHVMVVNEYIKDSPRKDVKHIVLHSLYQYMLHFYACLTCGNRVSDISGEFKIYSGFESLSDQSDSIMLLWKWHNRVNKRLESELRQGLPAKQQFPSDTLCPKCQGAKTQNDLVSTPNWYEKQVLMFLVHHYRPQSIIASNDVRASSSQVDSTNSASASILVQYHAVIITRSPNIIQQISSLMVAIVVGYFCCSTRQLNMHFQ